MTATTRKRDRASRRDTAPRVGLFGGLGMGNIGNDASMEAILGFLRASHPEAVIDAMCPGPDVVRDRFGVQASPMSWYRFTASGSAAVALKLLGKGIDAVRVAAWVRRHDAVIIPGMGIFEAALPVRASGEPYMLSVVGIAGRLTGTKVAYVSVGAAPINQRAVRLLFGLAARLAFYRSFRDAGSRETMRQWGIDVARDQVYPDLAFALPAPEPGPGDPRVVCVGVMDYHGSNDDRPRAAEIREAYVAEMKSFVRRLLADARSVRLLVGDTNGSDGEVVAEILADVRLAMPDLAPDRLIAQSVASLGDVMRAMVPAGSVVAIRFHNIVASLMLGKPTIAISYGRKHDAIMADSGVAEFCCPVNGLSEDGLLRRFTELESRSPEVRRILATRKSDNEKLLAEQFERLWEALFPERGDLSSNYKRGATGADGDVARSS
ncbi:MAG: rane protein [Actinomycetia bacterium]|nr:rane protein [Actinomycetes bacterium]